MKQKNILILLLAFIFIVGVVSGSFAARSVNEPGWWTLSSSVAISVLIFYWYHIDSTRQSFERSIWLNIGVIAFAPIAIPYYIFRRSMNGARMRAFARLAGYTGLLCISGVAGGMAGVFVI